MILALIAALATAAPAPTYLVERVVTTAQGSRRVSVFRDGVAVLAWRPVAGTPTTVRRRLDDVTLRSLRQVVTETAPDLRSFPGFEGVPGDASIELRLAPPDAPPLTVRMPVTAVPSVAASRLQRALDDVDQTLSDTRPGQEDLSAWQPAVGQRVALADGSVVTVLEVLNEGEVIHVRVGDGPGEIFFALSELRQRAVRLVGP